jgi:hypothetical protein
MIHVICPACSKHGRAPDAAAGRVVKCSKCGAPVRVPNADEDTFELMSASAEPRKKSKASRRLPTSFLVCVAVLVMAWIVFLVIEAHQSRTRRLAELQQMDPEGFHRAVQKRKDLDDATRWRP